MERIGKYDIIEKIGKGGMGIVYKAFDPRIGRVVAIKTLFAERGTDAEVRRRLLQEARSAGVLAHKNIITIYELDEDAEQAYIAMEYLEGEDLRSIIDRKPALPLEQKLHILIEVSEGLAHAHERGIFHRDLKPANIFVTRSGQVKILDFGLARVGLSTPAMMATLMGTPSYMAPEIVRGEPSDHRADIFSLGVIAYELIAYAKPFQADSDFSLIFKVAHTQPPPVEQFVPALPIELSSIIACAMEKDSDQRYQKAEDLLQELESAKTLLEERKRLLREDVRAEFRRLGELIRAHEDNLKDIADKLDSMKESNPEFFDSPSQIGDLTPKRSSPAFDYFTLVELRERTGREWDRIHGLLERRNNAGPLILKINALQEDRQFETALGIVDGILRDDPTWTVAATLRKEIAGRLEELARAGAVAELLAEAQSRFDAQQLYHCEACLDEVLELAPDHPGALALRAAVREKFVERIKREDRMGRFTP